MNGGIIDAEVGDDGKSTGKLSVDTRYLIVGKPPSDKSTKDALDGYSKIQSEATRLGVEQISVSKLLDLMGYKGEVNSVSLTKGSSAKAIKPKNVDEMKKSGGGSTEFKKRNAPERGKSGAY